MFSSSPLVFSLPLLLLSLLVVSLVGPRLLGPKTLPSIPLQDELDDLSLFRRATLSSPPGPHPAPPRREKVAFMFLTNSDLAFAPLWELFFAGHHALLNVYVHADPRHALSLHPTPSFRARFIPAKATQRASPTLISAARRLLAAALHDDPRNAYFALLSQYCVPLHSFPFLYNFLLSPPSRRRGRQQHRSFIEIIADDPVLHKRYVARGDDVMLPEVPFEEFRVGSQFFVLTRRHAMMVVRDRKLWEKFRLPCLRSRKNSCYPEEHYFPTLLSMQDPDGCMGYTLTRVNWTGSVSGHPHTYGPGEVSAELVHELRRSNSSGSYMFARKFSPACLDPLMEIANSVIFRD